MKSAVTSRSTPPKVPQSLGYGVIKILLNARSGLNMIELSFRFFLERFYMNVTINIHVLQLRYEMLIYYTQFIIFLLCMILHKLSQVVWYFRNVAITVHKLN